MSYLLSNLIMSLCRYFKGQVAGVIITQIVRDKFHTPHKIECSNRVRE